MRRCIYLVTTASLATMATAAPIAHVAKANFTIDRVNVANNAELLYGTMSFATDSLAITPGGQLFSADASGTLFDVTTPVALFAGNTGYSQIGDLDWASGGLWGFSNANQTLFFYDFGLSAVTFSLADPTLAALNVTGVAYRPADGSVFISGHATYNADVLFQLAPSAPSFAFIGTMPQTDSISYISDIDFDAGGTLIAMTWYHRWFYSVNSTTAATSLISTGPHRDVNAMALQSVPEPASFVGLAAGLALLRRRRR